ncbi:MAG: radical SAM/Cys-rich domain protein [Lentisphaerae bacterium]|nr:radical SAM/Cys-rich domain protein [Verrucomicrobiota bacterium]MBT7058730.1 radical SAM/Cys-rich domain protein [Lentisphaerota bacterium]MBT7699536.1 radical SAM/Cys-rich domain protein [Verrucomicrobiota bacterium]
MNITRQHEWLAVANAEESFEQHLRVSDAFPLRADGIEILQLNITRQCNLSCKHCHVEAGPGQSLHMADDVLEQCIQAAAHPSIKTIDITGGAPEMHPRFRDMIERLARLDKRLLVRSNLVILRDPPYDTLPALHARLGVELVASLPDVRGARTDRQRGDGVFSGVIEVMRRLNALGYAREGSALVLDVVHNPAGAYLPGDQAALEADYRRVLQEEHGVVFSRLFCITNCPVGRYLDYLQRSGNLADYMQTLRAAYNPAAAGSVMCRTTLSVAPDGHLYDCDFNQMLGLGVNSGAPTAMADFDHDQLAAREIVTHNHCFACTAGAGSSCQGATT